MSTVKCLVSSLTHGLIIEDNLVDRDRPRVLTVLVVAQQAELDVVARLLLPRPVLVGKPVDGPSAGLAHSVEVAQLGEVLVELQQDSPGLDIFKHRQVYRGGQCLIKILINELQAKCKHNKTVS